jgi:hypothetical protein
MRLRRYSAAILFCVASSAAHAQGLSFATQRPFVTGFIPVVGLGGAVGGVSVDARGVVNHSQLEELGQLSRLLQEACGEIPEPLAAASDLRKISLRRIEENIAAALAEGRPIPAEVQFLGGLTRIRYVLVFPDHQDIVLAGPAEPWKIDERANAIGAITGRPVMLLEDLLVALRTADEARLEGIQCSINPTDDGVRRLRSFLASQRQFSPAVVASIEQMLGPQQVTIAGVPATSHFARILVASDYRMKRIAMKLDESPVRGLVSYLDLVKSARMADGNMMPRWWLACQYEPLARSEDGLAWELRGPGVKAMTETDFLAADGSAQPTGHNSSVAQKWADQMTAAYDKLSVREPVFGQLRNLMDLSVVAALVAKEDLLTKAGCHLPHLLRSESPLQVGQWNAPTTIDTQSSFVKKGRTWIITASGGVQIDSWQVVDRTVPMDQLGQVHSTAAPQPSAPWWWNE